MLESSEYPKEPKERGGLLASVFSVWLFFRQSFIL